MDFEIPPLPMETAPFTNHTNNDDIDKQSNGRRGLKNDTTSTKKVQDQPIVAFDGMPSDFSISKVSESSDDESVSEWGDADDDADESLEEVDMKGVQHENNDKEEDGFSSLTEYRLTSRWRAFVSWSLIILGLIIPVVIYILIRRSDIQAFETLFESLADQFVQGVGTRIGSVLSALDTMSVAATSHALVNNETWPFVTMEYFDLQAANALALAGALQISLHPRVQDVERDAWERYSVEHTDWLSDGLARQEQFEQVDEELDSSSRLLSSKMQQHREDRQRMMLHTDDTGTVTVQIPDFTSSGVTKQIYKLDPSRPIGVSVEDKASSYFPSWQRVPLSAGTINFNLFTKSSNDRLAMEHVMSDGNAVIGRVEAMTGSEALTDQVHLHNPNATYQGDSVTNLFYPVFDHFDIATQQVVAMYTATIDWPAMFYHILPEENTDLIVVVENSCGDVFTYQVGDGDQSLYLGPNDGHDKDFDSFELFHDFARDSRNDVRHRENAPQLTTTFCPYTMRVYPSDELHRSHLTSRSWAIAGSVAALLALLGLVALAYDAHVQRRMKRIVTMERKKNAKKVDKGAAFSNKIHPKMRIKSYLTDPEDGNTREGVGAVATVVMPHTGLVSTDGRRKPVDQEIKPIADLFPFCTVMFAGIAGFESWSSEREPEQVFMLLAAIFQTFDDIARKRNVFKVETIGDNYVAVCGLPEQQADHAVRMVRFARQCLNRASKVFKKLEATLGPDTGELHLRIGLNSGQVTAGVLQGEKSRFKLCGDTINTASRIETLGQGNRIHLSESTADLLIASKKQSWIRARHDQVDVKGKGKGTIQTFWLIHGLHDDMSVCMSRSSSRPSSISSADEADDIATGFEDAFDVWDEGNETGGAFILPPMSRTAKKKRLVGWLVEAMCGHLKRIVAQRQNKRLTKKEFDIASAITKGEMVKDEVVEAFSLPTYNKRKRIQVVEPESVVLNPAVIAQLQDFITAIGDRYPDNHFHSFEHASHVTLSSTKILNRIVVPEDVNYKGKKIHMELHDTTFGIASDELAQFAVSLSALIHDVDHPGVPNGQLAIEKPELAEKYKNHSIAEQNSIDIAWDMLMDPTYKDLQECLFANENEVQRFRQYIVNLVLATDIFDKDMTLLRNKRWEKAFKVSTETDNSSTSDSASVITSRTQGSNLPEKANLKATIVLEHIIQASDVSHTMQHWNVYKKWNERLFQEMYAAYDAGRAEKNPAEGWYGGEIWFFDNYIIPLAKKLEQCGVFGVSSDEFLNYAKTNRSEWQAKGHAVVEEMVERYKKKKNLEIGGFTPHEINCLTPKELEHILQLLIKKGRMFGSFLGTDVNGQKTAAQAWLDSLEIHERAPASAQLADPTLIFPVFSGMLVFLKGGAILQDSDCSFEKNIAEKFVRDAEDLGDPVHFTRALGMLCEVQARSGDCKTALETFAALCTEYDPEKHHEGICKSYGTDRAVHAYSQAALWHHQLGDEEKAVQACQYVIDSILPLMDPKNILNSCELLLPVVRILCARGENKRMRDLFHKQVVLNFEKFEITSTPCRPIMKPLIMLLDMRHDRDNYPNFEEAVEWLLDEKSAAMDDFFDNMYVKLGWAPNTVTAELCLRVAKKLQNDGGDMDKVCTLVRKGLAMARKAVWKMHDEEGNVILPVALEVHAPVEKELFEYAETLGLGEDAKSVTSASTSDKMASLKTSFGMVRLKG